MDPVIALWLARTRGAELQAEARRYRPTQLVRRGRHQSAAAAARIDSESAPGTAACV